MPAQAHSWQFGKRTSFPPAANLGRRYLSWILVLAPSTRRARTKTNQQDDTLTVGIADRNFVRSVARFLERQCAPNEQIFGPLTWARFESLIAAATSFLKLQRLQIVPPCFRHAGPSYDAYHHFLDLATIQARGMGLAA